MEFRLLGPLEIVDRGRPIVVGAAKLRALLAILLLDANEVVSSGRLIDELWGERPPTTARKLIHGYVSQLRALLERSPGQEQLLVTRAPGYALCVDPERLDLTRFDRLVSAARAASAADPAAAADMLHEALSLWRGPPLAEFADEPFARVAIGRLEERRMAALEERIAADLRLGRHAELVGELEGAVAAEPLRERLRAELMLALYRSGRQAEALGVYRDVRALLVDELGIEPGKE